MTVDLRNIRETIREIQMFLLEISYLENELFRVSMDGFYGKETSDAVRLFQGSRGIPATGSVDFATWQLLFLAYTAAKEIRLSE